MSEEQGKTTTLTGTADVDGSEMKLFETPVDLPEKVVVVDGKLGKEIGFVEREKVMELLAHDPRYAGFEDPVTKKFMLSYNPDTKSKAIVLETEDVIRFLNTIENNLETAIGADDPNRLRLGVSYEDKGKMYVLYLHIRNLKNASKYLNEYIVDAFNGKKDSEVDVLVGPTQRLIELFELRAKKRP